MLTHCLRCVSYCFVICIKRHASRFLASHRAGKARQGRALSVPRLRNKQILSKAPGAAVVLPSVHLLSGHSGTRTKMKDNHLPYLIPRPFVEMADILRVGQPGERSLGRLCPQEVLARLCLTLQATPSGTSVTARMPMAFAVGTKSPPSDHRTLAERWAPCPWICWSQFSPSCLVSGI